MRLIHISPSDGQLCGVALFARSLAGALADGGLPGEVRREIPRGLGPSDVLLLHHHPELMSFDQLAAARAAARDATVVVFPHERLHEQELALADGIVAPYGDMAPREHEVLVVGLPVPVPEHLSPREDLREQFGLPRDRYVIGTSGFLRFEREFDRVAERLLPAALDQGWVLFLSISPWHTSSPGAIERLQALARAHPDTVRVDYGHVSDDELNLRLQACDLLWCWTRAASRPYASAVATTYYASGTRMVVTSKRQHEHVLHLPNVVSAPIELGGFVDVLMEEAFNAARMRHTPDPVSWSHVVPSLRRYLRSVGRVETP